MSYDVLQLAIDKVAAKADELGIDLSPEEMAGLAYEKLAEESSDEAGDEEDEIEEEEAEEEDEEEEDEEEEAEEEEENEKAGSLSAEDLDDLAKEAIDMAAEANPDLDDPEDLAKVAAQILDDAFEEKLAMPAAKKPKPKPKAKAKVPSPWKGRLMRAGKITGLLGAGAAGGYLAGRLAGQKTSALQLYEKLARGPVVLEGEEGPGGVGRWTKRTGGSRKTSPELQATERAMTRQSRKGGGRAAKSLLERALAKAKAHPYLAGGAVVGGGLLAGREYARRQAEKQSSLGKTASDAEVVQRSRQFLAMSGFDPDSGEPMSKVALAQNKDEYVNAAALELLESKGWPVQWDPAFLARRVEG